MSAPLIVLTLTVTVASVVFSVVGRSKLRTSFSVVEPERTNELLAFVGKRPWFRPLAMLVLLGHLLSLASLALPLPGLAYALLAFLIAWTGLNAFNAPNVQGRLAVAFYEFSLMLNGAVLALAFLK